MKKLITISLIANISILIPVCGGLAIESDRMLGVFGESTPARGILLSIYFSILLSSVLLLIHRSPKQVAVLLLVQVLYKISTPITVGTFYNPVVISNLIVATLHICTLLAIFKAIGNPLKENDTPPIQT
jgi:hypothetical protein